MEGSTPKESVKIGERAKGITGQNVDDCTYNENNTTNENNAVNIYNIYGGGEPGRFTPASGSSAELSSIVVPPHLPYLVDRSDQEEQLSEGVRTFLKSESHQTFLCIISGDDTECHEAFVDRIWEQVLPSFPQLHSCEKRTITPDWPRTSKQPHALRDNLTQKLSQQIWDHSEASLEEIHDHFRQYAWVLLRFYLPTDDDRSKVAELLDPMLQFWQRDWPGHGQSQGPYFFVSLCIKYRTSLYRVQPLNLWNWFRNWRLLRARKKVKRQTERYLAKLQRQPAGHPLGAPAAAAGAKGLSLAVLPPLEMVKQSCAEAWARGREVERYLKEHSQRRGSPQRFDTNQLIHQIQEFYGDWQRKHAKERIPMKDLAMELSKALQRQLSPR